MNVPYVKVFDGNGTLLNPIIGVYRSSRENRRERRRAMRLDPRGIGKIFSHFQIIDCRDPKTKLPTGERKTIKHYM